MKNQVYITKENIEKLFYNTPQIVFEVTEKCNLSCKYCFYGNLYENKTFRDNIDMMQEKAEIMLDLFVKYWLKNPSEYINQKVDIGFYGGEPLLNIKLIKYIVSYLEQQHIGQNSSRKITYSMTTNALLLHKYMDYIVDKEIKLTISLDGDEFGSSYRIFSNGESASKKIVQNVEKLRKKHPNYFRTCVEFNAVLHDRNTSHSIYNYFKKWEKIPFLSSLSDFGFATDTQQTSLSPLYFNNDATPEYREVRKWQNNSEYNQALTFLLKKSPHVYSDYNELLFGKKIYI